MLDEPGAITTTLTWMEIMLFELLDIFVEINKNCKNVSSNINLSVCENTCFSVPRSNISTTNFKNQINMDVTHHRWEQY